MQNEDKCFIVAFGIFCVNLFIEIYVAQKGGEMDRPQLTDKLSRLLASQKLAVLSTNREGQPYSCLVAIAGTADLKHLLFCTSRPTRKYGEIKDDPRVSVLIDNRSNRESDFRDAFAVTATGRAAEAHSDERDRLLSIYLAKHPHLKDFVSSPDNALIRVDVTDYVISTFQNVWTLPLD